MYTCDEPPSVQVLKRVSGALLRVSLGARGKAELINQLAVKSTDLTLDDKHMTAKMHEVVTLQFGQQANYLGTHYWNTQVGESLHEPSPLTPVETTKATHNR